MASKYSKSRNTSKKDRVDYHTRRQRTMQIIFVAVSLLLILSWVLSLVVQF